MVGKGSLAKAQASLANKNSCGLGGVSLDSLGHSLYYYSCSHVQRERLISHYWPQHLPSRLWLSLPAAPHPLVRSLSAQALCTTVVSRAVSPPVLYLQGPAEGLALCKEESGLLQETRGPTKGGGVCGKLRAQLPTRTLIH